jgi:hypothetical protein
MLNSTPHSRAGSLPQGAGYIWGDWSAAIVGLVGVIVVLMYIPIFKLDYLPT